MKHVSEVIERYLGFKVCPENGRVCNLGCRPMTCWLRDNVAPARQKEKKQ